MHENESTQGRRAPRERDEADDCTMCSGMAGGTRRGVAAGRAESSGSTSHRRITRRNTLAALPRINKRKHRWVVVGGSTEVVARRASEKDADDTTRSRLRDRRERRTIRHTLRQGADTDENEKENEKEKEKEKDKENAAEDERKKEGTNERTKERK